DEVRHLADFVDVAENLADSPLVGLRARIGLAGCVDRLGRHEYSLRFGRTPGSAVRLMSGAFPRLVPSIRSILCAVGSWPGRGRKSSGRTSPCGGAVIYWMMRI